MTKEIVYRQQARETFQSGLDALANAVRVTLGPRGRNVALERAWGTPLVTKDGVTVAEEIELAHKGENMGALLVKEVAQRTNDDIGDGTTTATVLAQGIYRDGMKLVEASMPAIELKRGIDKAVEVAVGALEKQAKLPKSTKETARIASVSANNDEEIGELLAEAFDKVGKDGVVTVEESQYLETVVEVVEGMEFDRGYLSPYFITDKASLVCEIAKPLVLVHEKKLSALADVVPALELAKKKDAPLLVIAEDVEGEALAALVVNTMRGVVRCAAAKAPGFGDRRKEMIKDIAAMVGATPFNEDTGRKAENLEPHELGRCDKAVLEKETCKIIKGHGKKEDIEARIKLINAEWEATNSTYDKDKLQERLARIAGGVALVKVGGATEVEVREKKHRVEDSMHATRAALQEGYVAGGGIALLRCSAAVEKHIESIDNDGERAGAELVRKALKRPLEQIAENAGLEAPIVIDKVLSNKSATYGFDAQQLEYCDMIKQGILDPMKVTRAALKNASSIAGLMLTTEAILINKPEPKPAGGAGMPDPSGMDMGMGGMPGMGGMGGMGGMPDMGGMDDHDHDHDH